jgi:hypothetical protein
MEWQIQYHVDDPEQQKTTALLISIIRETTVLQRRYGGNNCNGVIRQQKSLHEEKGCPQLSVRTNFHAWTSFWPAPGTLLWYERITYSNFNFVIRICTSFFQCLKYIFLPTVLFGCKLWSLTATQHKFQVFGNIQNVVFVYKEEAVRN